VKPYNVVVGYQHFRGPCCFYLHPEDGSSKVLRSDNILPQHYTASQPRRPRLEDGGSIDLRNVSILDYYTASQPVRPGLGTDMCSVFTAGV